VLYVISKLCLRFSTTVCDTQFTLILFFLFFFWTNFQSKRTTRAEPEDHLWSADHSLRNAVLDDTQPFILIISDQILSVDVTVQTDIYTF